MISNAIDTVSSEPDWIPHTLDFKAQSVEFVRVPSSQFAEPGFLFEFQPSGPADRAQIPFDAIGEIEVNSGPVHFVFHSAFCRSTLLARALNIEGVSIGMSEPGIIAALASAGPQARPLIGPLVRILGRQREGTCATFVKPTNHANRLIPDLLDACDGARAVLMTNPVEPFLKSVRKRGLMGHRWGRRLYLEMQSYAGMDLGMPPDEVFAMTDMQAAGLAWFLNQNYFARLANGANRERLRILDGDYFNGHRGETIAAFLDHCEVNYSERSVEDFASRSVFQSHSKFGASIAEETTDAKTAEEIAQVEQWLGLIAEQIGMRLPIRQTLLLAPNHLKNHSSVL